MTLNVTYYVNPKVKATLFKYSVGDYDFIKDRPAASKQEYTVKVVEFSQRVSKDYLRKVSDTKYEKQFLLKFPEEIKPNWYIIFEERRYNIKEAERQGNYYLVTCIASNTETLK